jgi:aminocarboxymuconate-semialdehyde decarboxylase
MKIDVSAHITPPKYLKALGKKIPPEVLKHLPSNFLPGLADLDVRFKIMDKYPDMVEVLTVANPPVETMLQGADAVDVSRQVNDEMAELIVRYPDRFVGAVACLPMNDVDEALKETDRAVKELHFQGIQLFTNIMGKPLDSPEFMPVYERMAQLDLPIWIHPFFENVGQVAQTEKQFSGYRVFTGKEDPAWAMDRAVFGLPSASARAIIRLVYSRVFDLYPNIKFLTHHCGAGVPFFANRIEMHYLMFGEKEGLELGLKKPVHEYFKLFYADAALHGNTPALMCGYNYFGPDRILFGTDMPFGSELGLWPVRKTIDSINEMPVPENEREKIYAGNARRLLRLKA